MSGRGIPTVRYTSLWLEVHGHTKVYIDEVEGYSHSKVHISGGRGIVTVRATWMRGAVKSQYGSHE